MIFQIPDAEGRQHDVDLIVTEEGDGRCVISETFRSTGVKAVLLITREMREHLLLEMSAGL